MTCRQSCVEMERERVENFLQSGKKKEMITHRDKIQRINPLLAFLKTQKKIENNFENIRTTLIKTLFLHLTNIISI